MWRVRHPKLARVVNAVQRMAAHLNRVRTFGLAAEMAFWVFLALVPLAAVAGLVGAKIAVHHWGKVGPHLAGLPPVVSGFVHDQLSTVAAWNGGAVALPAVAVFVWLASSGVHAIFDALEIQTQSSRPWWKKRAIAIVACVALSAGVALIALLGTGVSWIVRTVNGAVPLFADVEQSALGTIVRFVIGLLVELGLMAALFRIGVPPGPDRRQLPVLPGAALTTALQAAFGFGYGRYVATLGHGTAYSGALWAIGVTMTALYLFAIAILLGAELNRWLAARRALCAPRHQPSRLHYEHEASPLHRAR